MTLRRSFSAFPDGWPGHGLLLLRVTLGLPLVYRGVADVTAFHLSNVPDLAAALAGVFMISGLLTSSAGATIVLAQAWMALLPAFGNGGETPTRLFLGAVGASLAMLGPGAWSMDAHRFGRKVFEVKQPGSLTATPLKRGPFRKHLGG